MKRQRTVLLAAVAGSILFGAGGLAATWWVKSPQQAAADAAPPPPTRLTAAVDKRVLRQTVVLRGDVVPGQSFSATPSPRDGGKAVVTGVNVTQGGSVQAGVVIVEVGGRPLVALPGTKPAYRDLRPGYEGDDVRQLQAALKALGHDPKDPGGVFGEGTKRALTAFYTTRGFPVVTTSPDDDKHLAAADKQVRLAERAAADAQGQVDRARANEDLTEARKARDELRRTTGPMLPLSEHLFLPSFPARVDSLKASVGSEATTPLIVLSSGEPRIQSTVSPAQRGLLTPGMAVDITSEILGTTVKGTVTSIGDLQTDMTNAAGAGHPLTVAPSQPLPATFTGRNVRLTVEAAATGGEVLVLRVSALFSSADGSISVIRRDKDGKEERVPVTPGMSAEGFVEITGPVTSGDHIVVGGENR